MKTDKEKPTKKKNYLEFFTGFLLVLVVILSKQLFYKNTYDELERRLANNYYSADNIEMAIRNKLGAATEEGDSQKVFIAENFDNYVYQLVLDDINTYESKALARYNMFLTSSEAEKVLKFLDEKEALQFKEIQDICYIKIPGFEKKSLMIPLKNRKSC